MNSGKMSSGEVSRNIGPVLKLEKAGLPPSTSDLCVRCRGRDGKLAEIRLTNLNRTERSRLSQEPPPRLF